MKKLFKGNKKSLYMMIVGVVLVFMTLGTAILTSTLTIKGKSTIKKSSWVIYFDDIEIASDSAKNEDEKDDAKIAKDGTADLTKENIEFTANLKNPGDFYEFTVYTVNDGTIDAEIESVEKSLLSEEQQKYLEFEVKYDDGEEIKKCDVLQAGTRRLIKAVVKFKDGLDVSEYPKEEVSLSLFFKINYSQNVSCPVCQGDDCVVKNKLTIRPNGGTYEGRTATKREYLKTEETYTLKTPTRKLYNFTGWKVIDPETGGSYTFDEETFLFTMGNEDVIIEAQWEEGDYVARIMDTYYHTIQEAFDDASKNWEDNTVWLLKDTEEYPTNNTNKAFVFNLDGHTVKGRITNSKEGNITLVNGKVEGKQESGTTGTGEGVRNLGTLTLGVNDNNVQVENSITITGETYGLYNVVGSKFNFYDGYIEAEYAMSGIKAEMQTGSITLAPRHYAFVDHRSTEEKEYERVYLTPNPNRAVVKTTTVIETYYYNLQDAINDVNKIKATTESTDEDYILYAIRNFEAAYKVEVPSEARILLDLSGYNIQSGETITNKGYLKIYNTKENTPTISASKTIVNTGELDISKTNLKATADIDVIQTNNKLKLTDVSITTTDKYCVKNTGEGTLDFNGNVVLKSEDEYALYNSSNNVEIKSGTIYGLNNTGKVTLDGENVEFIAIPYKTQPYSTTRYIRAINNSGTITMNDGKITSTLNTGMIVNSGTFNYNAGTIHSEYLSIDNSGTVNVNDNEITATRTAISGGTINVLGTVSSTTGPTISSATTNVNGGEVKSSGGYAISGGTTYVNKGEVYSETTITIDNGNTIVQGGTVRSETTAVSRGSLTVKSGTVTGKNYAANVSNFTISGGEVTSENIAVNTTNATVSGGKVEGQKTGIVTDNITMTKGEITSKEGIGLTVNNKGLITGGEVTGGTYGVLNKNELTLGSDDGEITSETPVLKGETYGLYITGSTTNFYDGILKGQADGYKGEITGTPLGGVVLDGEEEIEGVHYETDYISRFENWLRIGESEYNTLNAASQAAEEGDTIVVTKDVDITFKQSVLGSEKELKLDLNGHKVTTTQTITNEAKLEIIDTSEKEEKEYDVGEYQGTLEFKKNIGIENVNELTLNGGRYEGVSTYLIDNKQTLVVNKADMETPKTAIYNDFNAYYGYKSNITINDINIISCYDGIKGTGTNSIGANDWVVMNGGIIRATNNGIGEGYVEMNGGEIIAGNNGIYGLKNSVYLNNDSKITATTGYAVYRGESNITINGGEYTSLNNIAIESHYDLTMNGGKVTGTTGLKNGFWWTGYVYIDGPIKIYGGEVIGTKDYGVYPTTNTLYVYGGEIKGNKYGIYNGSSTVIGVDDGVISKTTPVIIGDIYGVYTNGNRTYFFDGILKGKATSEEEEENRGHYGLIELIPDASMIEDDYEYIDKVKYHTQYLETLGDWLEVDGNTYNSINAAQAAISSEGTINVIKDAYVNFDQTMPTGKKITFNLNGHSVMVTRTIKSEGTNTFKNELVNDSGTGEGLLNGVNTTPLSVVGTTTILGGKYYSEKSSGLKAAGTVTIEGGTFKSDTTNSIVNTGTINFKGGEVLSERTYAVQNTGTFNMLSGEIKAYGGITGGNVTVEDGRIEGTGTTTITTSGNVVINGGEIYNEKYIAIDKGSSGKITVNDGIIKSDGEQAIRLNSTGEINGGEITGKTNGITTERNTLTINGGHIVGERNNGVNVNGTTTILGGIIEGGVYGVYSGGTSVAPATTTIGANDRKISIDLPVLKGETYGLYISQNSTLNFYDGILKGITYSYTGQITNIPEGSEIIYDEETIDEKLYQTAYLRGETDIVKNVNTGEIYTNLQVALDEASDGDRLLLLDSVPLYYEVKNSKNIVFNMAGHTISTNKKITNTGTLKIISEAEEEQTAETEAIIRTSTSMELITNTGALEFNNVTLRNTSSSNYVINNTNELKLVKSKIDSINGVNSSSKLTIEESEIVATSRAINNTGELKITKGTYTGKSYSIYSNSSREITIKETVLNGTYYNSGTNNVLLEDSILNGDLQNNRSHMTVKGTGLEEKIISEDQKEIIYKAQINGSVTNTNSGVLEVETAKINVGTSTMTNSATVKIKNSEYRGTSTSSYYIEYPSITNSGEMEITKSNLYDCTEGGSYSPIGISNSGTLTLEESNLYVGKKGLNLSTIKGIRTNGSGKTTIEESNIYVDGGATGYGIYSDSTNALTTIKTGEIRVTNTTTGYGAYINQGTFTMGEYDGAGDETAEVSQESPKIYAQGTSRGIGVKKINGNFNFYDGVIWASRYTKPETTTNVELNYEVTTYVDEETGYEYAWLEYMKDDYMHSEAVAKIGETFYPTVQAAIEKVEPGEEIIILKSTQEEKITVSSGTIAKINLNGHSITTRVENNGIIQIYNGSLQSFEETTVENNGTLIMGEDDGKVSSTSVRIVSENKAVENNGTFIMYDGYLEGNPAKEGEIDEIAEYARLYTTSDSQSERIFLQSLSEESIKNKETALILTIDPNTGLYENDRKVKIEYLYYQDTYELKEPTKSGCIFKGWEVTGNGEVEGNKVTVETSDITVKAIWEVSPDAVAKVGEEYYTTLTDAIYHAKNKELVELFKDVEEDITVDKEITIDLGGKTVTGEFINLGILKVINGTIENPEGIGILNKKTLTLGENDGEVETEGVKIIGTTIGIQQEGRLNFYDGYIEGEVALNGAVASVPKGYYLYNEHNSIKDCQRVYLIGNPANAVAVTTEGGTQYFFSLQDAIDTASITGNEIFIVRDFEASYPVTVKEGTNILINMNSYNITTGNTITNNGTLKIYDSSEDKGSITTAKAITNNGDLTVENITIKQNKEANVMINKGNLKLVSAELSGLSAAALNTYGTFEMDSNSKLVCQSSQALVNNQTETLVLNTGYITGITNNKKLIVDGDVVIKMPASNTGIYMDVSGSSTIFNGGTIETSYRAIRLNGSNITFEMNGGTLKSTDIAISSNGKNNNIKITDGEIISTNSYGIYEEYSDSNYRSTIDISGGKITSNTTYGLYTTYDNVTISGGEINTLANNKGTYAVYCSGGTLNVNGGTIGAKFASGIYAGNELNVNGGLIYSNREDGYGIYFNHGTLNINGGTVETTGSSSYGIISDNSGNNVVINMTDGEIKSENVGIYPSATNSSYSKKLNIYGGKIKGGTYGIQQTTAYCTTTIGRTSDELSTSIPYITGGLYGIYRTNGNLNFYNGRLRGYTYGYNKSNSFNNIRSEMDVVEYIEDDTETIDIKTVSTTNVSNSPVSEYTKKGNGYVRITYIGESDMCENGTIYEFDYTGEEETFNTPCTGKYKLEVWGAQGGSYNDTYYGGYGAYSKGEINLTLGEMLYINVGGAGKSVYGTNVTADGGYNGGGSAIIKYGSSLRGGSGGGATHIATKSGLLSTLENNKDSVLIVAGGGGGSAYYTSGNYGTGGSGGGYEGNNGYSKQSSVYGTGGTQTSGGHSVNYDNKGVGTFGQGASTASLDNSSYYGGAGGGGWYGGGAAATYNTNGGGGGSGYIGNSRLTEKVMYGYNVAITPGTWINNYLVEKEAFLQVGDETFNSIDKAQAAIEENGTGTIIVIKDAEINEASTLPSGKNITFDLNGHTLIMTQSITNKGNLNVIDSAEEKGMISNVKINCFLNEGNITVDSVNLKSSNNTVIIGQTSAGSITVNNSTLEGYNGIWTSSKMNINVTNSNIKASNNGIYSNAANTTVNVNSTTINAQNSGIHLDSNVKQNLTVEDSTITGKNYGVRLYVTNSSINIKNTDLTGTEHTGLYYDGSSGGNTTIVTGGHITGYYYGIYNQTNSLTLNGPEIKNTISNSGYYALMNYSTTVINDGTKITSENANAIYNNSNLTINGGEISSSRSDGVGIYANSSTLTINGGKIKTTGGSSYAIKNDNNSSSVTINMNGGEIESENIGVYIYETSSSYSKKLNVYGGSIIGKTYGIYQTTTYCTTTIGDSTKSVSVSNPYIEGGLYSIYKTAGTLNFYSGLLKGYSKAYSAEFNTIREGYEIYEETDELSTYLLGHRTVSTEDSSLEAISETAKEGNGYARITYTGTSTVKQTHTSSEELNCEDLVGREYLYGYQGKSDTFIPSCAGKYKVELWGAQGGTVAGYAGGKGAYTSGEINLKANDKLYVYVGESYSEYKETMSFNGGGHGSYSSASSDKNGNGGGATDIRLVNGDWNNFDSLKSRIMVAAGGGGASNYSTGSQGGYGGTLIGGSGNHATYSDSGYAVIYLATGGTQNSGGLYAGSNPQPGNNVLNGTFGSGGYGSTYYVYRYIYNAGGGGGYYGGGAGGAVTSNVGSAAGGSSFISGYDGCDAISEDSTVDNIIHTGQSIHYSNYKFNNPVMIAGNEEMPNHTGTSVITGNSGNGYAKITLLEVADTSTVQYISDYGTIENNTKVYNTGDKLGELPTPILSDNDMVFDGWYIDTNYKNKVDEEYIVKGDMKLFAKFIYSTDSCTLEENTTYDFDYTGDKQVFESKCTGNYKLEVWGAQGGNSSYNSFSYTGGYGGYTSGEITLLKDEKLYIYVGGQGAGIDYKQSSKEYTFDENTGYNGGGYATIATNNSSHGGGGGATHIATNEGLLKELSSKKQSVIMVAGGGGGAASHSSSPSYSGNGGSGGGEIGGSGIPANTTCYNYGNGGTQGEGGSYTKCSSGSTSRSGAPSNPVFGLGSNYSSNTTSAYYAGGGGGYYGGQSGYQAPGGGGSGYNSNPRVTNKIMVSYNQSKFDSSDSNIAYLVKSHEMAINNETSKKYTNLQEAIDEANDGETIKLISDANISYSITNSKDLIIDLDGYNLLTSKSITNNGTLSIVNNNTESSSKLYANLAITLLSNTSTLNISNITISSGATGINNTGKLTISNSTVTGTSYALYDNSTLETKISDSKLSSSNTAYYKNSTGITTILDTIITGNVTNNNANGKLEITNKNITGFIVNKGNTTIKNTTINITSSSSSEISQIQNSGVMTLTNNNITNTNTTSVSSNGTSRCVYNTGTLTSTDNNYKNIHNYNNSKSMSLIGIRNDGILNSKGDTFVINYGYYGYAISTYGSNYSNVENAVIDIDNISQTAYGLRNHITSASTTIKDSTVNIKNVPSIYGIYVDDGSVTTSNVTYSLTDSTSVYGTYMNKGTLIMEGGTFDINGTTSTGIALINGNVTIERGTYKVNGTNTYGINMTNGTLTLGTYDGRGTDAADVSTTDPYILANGTNSGIGISMGSGTFKFYDGYFSGSTSARPTGDILSETEKNYELKENVDPETGYKYCVLEYTR